MAYPGQAICVDILSAAHHGARDSRPSHVLASTRYLFRSRLGVFRLTGTASPP